MTHAGWRLAALAAFVAAGLGGPLSSSAHAQYYGRDQDRGWDRDRDWDRRDERRRGDWDERRGFRFEFGNRDRDRRCSWVVRRYYDDNGDEVVRRRRVCD